MEYVNHNFHQNISLGEVAKLVNMTEMSFSRFSKGGQVLHLWIRC